MSVTSKTAPSEQDTEMLAHQVSWQTALMILFSLLANVMAQPCGQVCGAPSLYSTYLRSSPVVCAIDSITLTCQIVIQAIRKPRTFRATLREIIETRYEINTQSTDGLASIRNQSGLRVLLFLLAGVLPFIKLAGMQGLPGTKTIGIVFFSSFVLHEIFVIYAVSFYVVDQALLRPPPANRSNHFLGFLGKSSNPWLLVASGVGTLVTLVLHVAPTIQSIRKLRPRVTPARDRFGNLVPWLASDALVYSIVMTAMAAAFAETQFATPSFSGRLSGVAFWGLLASYFLAWLPILLYYSDRYRYTHMTWAMIEMSIIFWVLTFPIVLTRLIKVSSHSFPRLGQNLLVVDIEETGENQVSLSACSALTFFLVNVATATLWYSRCYDPAGTFSPSWTSLLG